MTTKASLVLEFGTGVDSGAVIIPELDPVRNVDADGNTKTNFDIDDDNAIFFLVHLQSGLIVEWVRPTNGTISDLGTTKQQREQRCSFSFADDARTVELKYIPASAPIFSFYGNTPILAPAKSRNVSVLGAIGLPAVGDAVYNVNFRSFCLHVPADLEIPEGKTEYPIEIRIRIEAIT